MQTFESFDNMVLSNLLSSRQSSSSSLYDGYTSSTSPIPIGDWEIYPRSHIASSNSASDCNAPNHDDYSCHKCGVTNCDQFTLFHQRGPVECYHPSGAAGAAYMPSTAGGAQPSAQSSLRVQPTPQPSAPPAPQQDMSKTTMAGHSYVSQNQTPQPRPHSTQFTNYNQYRPAQHGSRPNTHPRQQQSYIPNAAATATGPVMYQTLVFQPTPMGMQSYQQPRNSTPGYYPYMGHYIGYNTPPSHTSPYYYTSNSPQLPTPNLQANAQGGRSNPTTLVGPQGTPATPTAPTATLPHPQASTLMHQTMPGIRPSAPKRSRRVPIIDPKTQQEVDFYNNDTNFLSSEANDRHTPQPPEPTHSIAEEFNRMVNEVANQPSCDNSIKSNYVSKNMDAPVASTASSVQTQPNAICSINNNLVKSEILTVNESKNVGPDVVVESNETPIVSAISDSPVIVPKMPMNIKQLQKNSEPTVQSLVLDTNKNIPPNKQFKQSKNVPQVEELEKASENVNVAQVAIATVAPITTSTAITSTVTPVLVSTQTTISSSAPTPVPTPAPQPQRIREPRERVKSEDKEKLKERESQEKENASTFNKLNGPTPVVISSVDSLAEAITLPTSQSNQGLGVEPTKKQIPLKQFSPAPEAVTPAAVATNVELVIKSDPVIVTPPTATQLLSASIEKVAKEQLSKALELKEGSSAIEAQAKLTQSISSVLRTNQSDLKMKDINLNNKTTDPDTANGNTTEMSTTETVKEDINKNEKALKNTKNSNKKSANKMAINESNANEAESYENGKNETDKVVNVEQDNTQPADELAPEPVPEDTSKIDQQTMPQKFVPKYKYNEDQWSPLNTAGKKCYDIDLMKQIKEDPMSKNKPNVPLLEQCNVIRTTPMQEPQPFTPISRPMNDSLFPPFAKTPGMGSRNNTARDTKKDSRNTAPTGKGSGKLTPNASGNSAHKPVIHVSLSLREEVKLNEVDSAWKPTRFRKDSINEEEFRTQELYKKFRGILNKLTPQKFDTLLDRVKTLDINNQTRLEGVIDLVFEKAIDEPNFSEAYAAMCNKLSVLKVPADNPTSPDKCVNFRALIITKCQKQFQTHKVDEQILKYETELAATPDPARKRELSLMIDEENRRLRMRSVGNVRFIGELYKLKMLTSKIMDYCMKYLIEKVEEEKLECLCKLLTTIGEQVENEVHGQLDNIFKKMQDIVERKSNKISSRVRFMLQDVIELRKRKWVAKTVIDSQPKMMDQIQKEAEQQQRHIELMNASPIGGFRRDEGGRGKRGGDGRRQNANNSFIDNTWKSSRANYPVDTLKLKAVTQKNLTNIKLAPHNSAWNHGSGTKNTAQASSNSMISISKNKFSVLENVQTDPTSLRANRDMTPNYSKGASIERSTFNRGDFTASGSSSRSGSVGVARSNSGTRSTSAAPIAPPVASEAPAPAPAPAPVPQEPLPEPKKKSVKSLIALCIIINSDPVEMVAEVKQLFTPQYHAAVVNEILNITAEEPAKAIALISKALLSLVASNIISTDNFVSGIKEILEIAPDLYIDIPMLYDNFGKILAPQIEKKHITFVQIFRLSESIIAANNGHLFLKAIIRDLKESMGPSFVKSKWQESGLQIKQWMDENLVSTWLADNKFEFLEGDSKVNEETKIILSPTQTQSRLIQLMNAEESCECIKGWIQDKIGSSTNEDWFMRALIQAICEHALFGPEGRDVPHFNQDRMNKYASLIHDFGETKQSREASCLFGIQQLIRRLEHPQGLTLEIFQYLHEQYIISLDGFIAWEESEKEPEGKGVMMKALVSFFTNIKEADNEDSCSED